MLRLAATILCVTGLTACGDKVRVALPPVELAACADDPVAPDLPVVDWSSVDTARPVQLTRDQMTLDYILGLRAAGGDCRADVAGLRAWRETVER